jgi:hypothetical protein
MRRKNKKKRKKNDGWLCLEKKREEIGFNINIFLSHLRKYLWRYGSSQVYYLFP